MVTSGQHGAGPPALVPPRRLWLTLHAKPRELIDPHAQLLVFSLLCRGMPVVFEFTLCVYIYLDIDIYRDTYNLNPIILCITSPPHTHRPHAVRRVPWRGPE